jgi:NAD+ kinase
MKIAVLPNLSKNNAQQYTVELIRRLRAQSAVVLMDAQYQAPFAGEDLVYFKDFFSMLQSCDLAVAVGGDGTIIHAAKHAAVAGKPLLGINLGRLGFVAGMEPDELHKLPQLFSGAYRVEKRMMLSIVVQRPDGVSDEIFALNDAVISRGALSRIVDLTVEKGGGRVCRYRADGLIVSTPTGSTAYALSAGGPVLEPLMKCMLLTPICAHSLFSRSILFDAEAVLTVAAQTGDAEGEAYLTVDGERALPLYDKDRILIRRASIEAQLVNMKDQDFYEILSEKLAERRM